MTLIQPDSLECRVLDFLAEEKKWKAIAFLKEEMGWDDKCSKEYIDGVFRSYAEMEEKRLKSSGADTISRDLEEKILSGRMDPAGWHKLLLKGFYLEKRRCFIPWGAPFTLLEKTPGAVIEGDLFYWKDDVILGGIAVEVSTGMMMSLRGLFRLNCKPPGYGFDGWPEEGMITEYEELLPRLGPPQIPFGRSGCRWDFGTVTLTLECHSANEMYYTETWHKYLEFDVV